jgi:hypothetical protein
MLKIRPRSLACSLANSLLTYLLHCIPRPRNQKPGKPLSNVELELSWQRPGNSAKDSLYQRCAWRPSRQLRIMAQLVCQGRRYPDSFEFDDIRAKYYEPNLATELPLSAILSTWPTVRTFSKLPYLVICPIIHQEQSQCGATLRDETNPTHNCRRQPRLYKAFRQITT